MIETECFRELNIFGPNDTPSPDLLIDNGDNFNAERKRKTSFLARIFHKAKVPELSSFETSAVYFAIGFHCSFRIEAKNLIRILGQKNPKIIPSSSGSLWHCS